MTKKKLELKDLTPVQAKEVSLSEKQIATITQIQQAKAQLKAKFDDLNQQESMVIELVLEFAGIPVPVESIDLKEGKLIVKLKEK